MRYLFQTLLTVTIAWLSLPSAAWSAAQNWPKVIDTDGSQWLERQIKGNLDADFNAHCGADVSTDDVVNAAWNSDCRTIKADSLRRVLLNTDKSHNIVIKGARIVGNLSLDNQTVAASTIIDNSIVDGNISWARGGSGLLFALLKTYIRGSTVIDSVRSSGDLYFRAGSRLDGQLRIVFSRFDGNLDISGSSFLADVDISNTAISSLFAMNSIFSGEVDFSNMKLAGSMLISGATFQKSVYAQHTEIGLDLAAISNSQQKGSIGDIDLSYAHISGSFVTNGTKVSGTCKLYEAVIKKNIEIDNSSSDEIIEYNNFDFKGTTVGGDLVLIAINLTGTLIADDMNVDGSVRVDDSDNKPSRLNSLSVQGAKIARNFFLRASEITGDVTANSIVVKGDFSLYTTCKNLFISGAKINGVLSLEGVNIRETLMAFNLEVASNFIISERENRSSFQNITFDGAKVNGSIRLSFASIKGLLSANALIAHRGFFLDNTIIRQGASLRFSTIENILTIAGSNISGFDLSNSNVRGQFVLGNPPAIWRNSNGSFSLDLRSAHVQSLVDTKYAWPERGNLYLEGFTFDNLGGSFGDSAANMYARGMNWWDNWAQRDPRFSPTPYKQLSDILYRDGNRDEADRLRYLGRVREKEIALSRGDYINYIVDTVLQSVAGFGIGSYAFRALAWLFSLILLFAGLMWFFVPETKTRERGLLWTFGASFARCLPAIEINKEFTSFFDDAKRERFGYWMAFCSSAANLLGWIIGAIVLLAFSNLALK